MWLSHAVNTGDVPIPDTPAGLDGQAPRDVDKALLGGPTQRVGVFEYSYVTDTWTWSDAVAHIHGYEPGEVVPTTELVLSHKHPDDLAFVQSRLLRSSAPFSSRHRIRTTSGDERKVVVVGDPVTDDDGTVIGTRGFYIDITDAFHSELQNEVGEELEVIVNNRAAIEQAKGMLMIVYGLDQDSAFEILRWRSQSTNTKVHDIAAALVAELPSAVDITASVRAPADHFLMTLTRAEDA
jgi:PAS domain S-box-containing protein